MHLLIMVITGIFTLFLLQDDAPVVYHAEVIFD